MRRISIALALLAALVGSSGCSVLSWVKTRIKVRHARCDAWYRFTESHECLAHYDDIQDGFEDGYEDFVYHGIAAPYRDLPHKYTRSWYRTCFGRQEIEAWREGYLFGQSMASRDCLGRGACANGGCSPGGPGPGPGPGPAPGATCSCGVEQGRPGFGPPQFENSGWQPTPEMWHPTEGMEHTPVPTLAPELQPSPYSPPIPSPPPDELKTVPPAADPSQPMPAPPSSPPPSARLELPAPTAQELTPEDAAKDPPQSQVPARNASAFGPLPLNAPGGVPYAPVPEGYPFDPRFAVPPDASRGPQLMTPTDVPPGAGPVTIETPAGVEGVQTAPSYQPVQTPPISFGQESPGRVSVSSDPFVSPAPGQPLPANQGWKPLDWKPTRSPGAQSPTGSYPRLRSSY